MHTYEVIYWKDIKQKIKTLTPDLVNTINRIKGSDSFQIIRVKYKYGETIINKGQFLLECHFSKISILKGGISEWIKKIDPTMEAY